MRKLWVQMLMVAAVVSFGVPARGQDQPQPDARTSRPQPAESRAERLLEQRPDLSGRITAVAADGKSITLATRGRGRGAPDSAATTEIKLTDATQSTYWNVEAGGAKPTVGYEATVILAEGSKDTAARIRFMASSEDARPQVYGRITAVSEDGKSITVAARVEGAAGEVPVKITDRTKAVYSGVETGGAKPTVGYTAAVWMETGSKEDAARIRFSRDGAYRLLAAPAAGGRAPALVRPDAARQPDGQRPVNDSRVPADGERRADLVRPDAGRQPSDQRPASDPRAPAQDRARDRAQAAVDGPAPEAAAWYYTRGAVDKLDGVNLLVKDPRDASAPAIAVPTDSATTVTIAGKPAKLTDIPAGARVRITRDAHTNKATRVEVLEPGDVE